MNWIIIALCVITTLGLAGCEDRAAQPGPIGPETWSAEDRQYITERHEAAGAMIDHGEFGQARVVLEDLTGRYPGDAEGHALLARAYFATGQKDRAYEAAGRAVELDPTLVDASDFAGILAEGRGELERARALYARAAEHAPQSPKYRMQLANVLLKLDDIAGARREARAALELDPTVPLAHGILGYAARAEDRPAEAAAHFREAVRLAERPNRRLEWSIKLAQALRASGEAGASEAVNVLSELPEDWRWSERIITEELAAAHEAMGAPTRAAEAWRAWFNANPDDAGAAAEAGLAYVAAASGTDDADLARAYRMAASEYLDRAKQLKAHHPRARALEAALSDGGS